MDLTRKLLVDDGLDELAIPRAFFVVGFENFFDGDDGAGASLICDFWSFIKQFGHVKLYHNLKAFRGGFGGESDPNRTRAIGWG